MAGRKNQLHREFTCAAIKRAVSDVAAGASYNQVARKYGTTHTTVRRWCGDRDVRSPFPKGLDPRYHRDPTVREQLIEAVRNGDSMRRAAKRLHVSQSSALRWCRSAGVQTIHVFTNSRFDREHAA